MTLRQSGKHEFLEGISYSGGVDDPAVWNHFEAQGRLRANFEHLDIHISCPVPDDPEVAAKSIFYIDDVSLQAIEEAPMIVSTALDEYYVGESIQWALTVASSSSQANVQLLSSGRLVSEQKNQSATDRLLGSFETAKLKPGIYIIKATLNSESGIGQTAQSQILLTPAIFDSWKK